MLEAVKALSVPFLGSRQISSRWLRFGVDTLALTYADVWYVEHERYKLDFWQAESIIQLLRIPVVKVANVFQDHMVLQRDKPIKFWGWSTIDKTFLIAKPM